MTMKRHLTYFGALAALLGALWCDPLLANAQDARAADESPPAPVASDNITVQTRGPVHEAYAQPQQTTPQPGPIVPKQPPDPVPEQPPDQKPEGADVQWIPGYWAWDTDRNDYLWVSGFWRAPPPDRKWVPGHWNQVEGGWQWVPGFWAAAAQDQSPYVPTPPPPVSEGPSVPAPDENSIFVPGTWLYRDGRWVWRPGFWMAGQPGYVWTPDHYSWTPAGCQFVSGYWDYDLASRGLLFAPVYFNQPLWTNPGWFYTPNYCVSLTGLFDALFVRPDFCHYYFGDFFGDRFLGLGFQPWCLFGPRHHDALFGYYAWRHHAQPDWFRHLHHNYLARLHGDLPRLPHTLAEQHALVQRFHREGDHLGLQVARPLREIAQHRPLERLTANQVAAQRHEAERFHAVRAERHGLESRARLGEGRPAALPLQHVPTAARPAAPEHHPAAAPHAVQHQPPQEHRPVVSHPFVPQDRPLTLPHAPMARPPQAYYPPQHVGPGAWSPPPAHAFASPPHHLAPTPRPHPAPAFHGGGHPAPAFHGGGGHGGGHHR
jgi:hypothetical protein